MYVVIIYRQEDCPTTIPVVVHTTSKWHYSVLKRHPDFLMGFEITGEVECGPSAREFFKNADAYQSGKLEG